MRTFSYLTVSLTLLFTAIPAHGDSFAYIESANQTGAVFGTLDLSTGSFQQIGPGLPDQGTGLVPQSNGTLLTLGFDGTLNAINTGTGIETAVGPTGLGDCSIPGVSPCGPNSAWGFGNLNGALFATDLAGNLYSVNPVTGLATKIGPTGLPTPASTPGVPGPSGAFIGFDQNLFEAGGKLYTNDDIVMIDPTQPNPVVGIVLPDALYQIDTGTGLATLIAPTLTPLNAFVNVDGTEYGFDGNLGQVVSLDLTNGNTAVVSDYDPAAGLLSGAAPTPEPANVLLVGAGIAAVGILRRGGR
jgi:hypothetical protein